jgi:hypothetical protein
LVALDSRLHGNDRKGLFLAFHEFINSDALFSSQFQQAKMSPFLDFGQYRPARHLAGHHARFETTPGLRPRPDKIEAF